MPKIESDWDWESFGLGIYWMKDLIDYGDGDFFTWNHAIIVMIGPLTIGVQWD